MSNAGASIESKLNAIRALVDVDLSGVDISEVEEHGKRLSAIMGLSAETMAQAKKACEKKLLAEVKKILPYGYPPTVLMKIATAECAEENSDYEYADRLNAGITHQLDFIRTVISKWKTEKENSMRYGT